MSTNIRSFASSTLTEFGPVLVLYLRVALVGGLCGLGASVTVAFLPSFAHWLIWPVLILAFATAISLTTPRHALKRWYRTSMHAPSTVSFRELPKIGSNLERLAVRQLAELEALNLGVSELPTLHALHSDIATVAEGISSASQSLLDAISKLSQAEMADLENLNQIAQQSSERLYANEQLLKNIQVSVNDISLRVKDLHHDLENQQRFSGGHNVPLKFPIQMKPEPRTLARDHLAIRLIEVLKEHQRSDVIGRAGKLAGNLLHAIEDWVQEEEFVEKVH